MRRNLTRKSNRNTFVNVVVVERAWGGPEEGGWSYESERRVVVSKRTRAAHAEKLAARWAKVLKRRRVGDDSRFPLTHLNWEDARNSRVQTSQYPARNEVFPHKYYE